MGEDRRAAVAAELRRAGYEGLFLQMDSTALDALWGRPGAPEALRALATAPDSPPLIAFLAAEVLFSQEASYPPPEERERLAAVYATALEQNLTAMANPWGLPGQLDGPVGQHVVALGESAVPALTRLLDSPTPVEYGGSREATYGNRFGYRVKDLAAYYLSRIRDVPYEVKQTPRERDAEIKRLRASLS